MDSRENVIISTFSLCFFLCKLFNFGIIVIYYNLALQSILLCLINPWITQGSGLHSIHLAAVALETMSSVLGIVGSGLQIKFQGFSPQSSWWRAWWHAGRPDAGTERPYILI